ncbi:MAG: carbohydrate-binding family 9-like protein [Planctomycetota bacterium]|nr:carbohydrate-binding family 9-like protein [Planctomycetota bacterium]
MIRQLVLVAAIAVVAGCGEAREGLVSDADMPNRNDGRVEPAVSTKARRPPYPQRLQLIEAAVQARAEAIAKFPPPSLVAPRVPDGSIRIDGDIGDRAWQDAPVAVIGRDTATGSPAATEARARVVWDSKAIYFAFDLDDREVAATITKHDDELWREDVAEFFLDPYGDETSYIEVEVNPILTVYDATVADYRPESIWRLKPMNIDVERTPRIFRALGLKVAVKIDGKINDPAGDDRGWTCEIMLPWTDIARGANTRHLPPRDGDVWRLGLFRNDVNPGRKTESYAAWNPTLTWFHRPWSFGRLIFIER